MPRPDWISEETYKRLQEELRNDTSPQADMAKAFPMLLEDVYLAGAWLSRELEPLPYSEEDRGGFCFSAGRLCMGRDPWEVCRGVIEALSEEGAPEAWRKIKEEGEECDSHTTRT